MAYKIKAFETDSRWGASNYDVKQYLGLRQEEKWPKGELGPVVVPLMDGRTTLLWLVPFVPGPEYRGKVWKTSKHRTFTSCPDCGATVPAGRTHQHKCKYNAGEALDAIQEFFPKAVQGLYNYSHYERADGAWFQTSIDRSRKQVTFCPSEGAKFLTFRDIKHLGIYLATKGKAA